MAPILASLIGLLMAPALMAKEGWDDHDRSTKFTVRDFATDYLESCAPNAILFTYGDNDTYPLWYVQEVENVRPDIRIVNLSLLGTDWYINQLTKKVNQSAPLPISMKPESYIQGTRDVLYFNDFGFKTSIELSIIVKSMLSEDPNDKLELRDNSLQNFLPTKNFKLSIDPDQVLRTNTVPQKLKNDIVPVMEWKYNSNYVTKSELALLDILANNNWERPVYFAVTVPSENYRGLDKYLYNEGLAARLLPIEKQKAKQDSTKFTPDLDRLNVDTMYRNILYKFKWGNMKKATYLDPESVRMLSIFKNNFYELAEALMLEGRMEEAKKVLSKCLEVMPSKIYSLPYAIRNLYLAEALYKAGLYVPGNEMLTATTNYVFDEANYLYSVTQSKSNAGTSGIQMCLSLMKRCADLTGEYRQVALNKTIQGNLELLENKFFPGMQRD